jgi:hypothetical protein
MDRTGRKPLVGSALTSTTHRAMNVFPSHSYSSNSAIFSASMLERLRRSSLPCEYVLDAAPATSNSEYHRRSHQENAGGTETTRARRQRRIITLGVLSGLFSLMCVTATEGQWTATVHFKHTAGNVSKTGEVPHDLEGRQTRWSFGKLPRIRGGEPRVQPVR